MVRPVTQRFLLFEALLDHFEDDAFINDVLTNLRDIEPQGLFQEYGKICGEGIEDPQQCKISDTNSKEWHRR